VPQCECGRIAQRRVPSSPSVPQILEGSARWHGNALGVLGAAHATDLEFQNVSHRALGVGTTPQSFTHQGEDKARKNLLAVESCALGLRSQAGLTLQQLLKSKVGEYHAA